MISKEKNPIIHPFRNAKQKTFTSVLCKKFGTTVSEHVCTLGYLELNDVLKKCKL